MSQVTRHWIAQRAAFMFLIWGVITFSSATMAQTIVPFGYHDVYDQGEVRMVIGSSYGRRYFSVLNFDATQQKISVFFGNDFKKGAKDKSIVQSFSIDALSNSEYIFLDNLPGNPKFVSAWNLGATNNVTIQHLPQSALQAPRGPLGADAQPWIRMPPAYPKKCSMSTENTEHVVLTFNITSRGDVTDIKILETTKKCFNEAAKKSVEQWVYIPLFISDEWAQRLRVKTRIEFRPSN